MNYLLSWTIERDEHDNFVLSWWPRNDVYCLRNYERLSSDNFSDALAEAKYFLNLD